ncbi:MAG TPA: LemA family protein [Geminicoccaceae bacterium]|nr:LemA family protein [Geminicoccaceae bacterium]
MANAAALQRPGLRLGLLLVGLLVPLLTGCGINTIPTLEEQVNGAWAQVQNQYQRRADLIPNLVETVKGFAQQEQDVLIAVTEARAKVGQTQLPPDILEDEEALRRFEQNQAELGGALGRLMVVVEQYPELRSNQNFLALQSQLEGTENRIAVARRDFVQAVQAYNTEIRTFPGRLWAMVYGAEPKANFTASPGAEQAPRVTF